MDGVKKFTHPPGRNMYRRFLETNTQHIMILDMILGIIFEILFVMLVLFPFYRMYKRHTTYIDKILSRLSDDNWVVRQHALKKLQKRFSWRSDMRMFFCLLSALKDKEWNVRYEAVKVLSQSSKKCPVLLPAPIKSCVTTFMLHRLHDEHPCIRQESVRVLRKMRAFQTLPALLAAFHDPDTHVQEEISHALRDICISVEKLSFRNDSVEVFKRRHLKGQARISTPALSRLPLKEIEIDPATCAIAHVETFTAVVGAAIQQGYLKKHLCIRIYGNPLPFSSAFYALCNQCKSVDVSLKYIIFGPVPPQHYDTSLFLYNPDVSRLTVALSQITQIRIEIATHNFYQVEQFLTYVVNYLGQQYLKGHVDVSLYGNIDRLHPNLRNSLTNLCRRVQMDVPMGGLENIDLRERSTR